MYIVFQCKKCGHELYIPINPNLTDTLKELLDSECPACGEEAYEIWILVGIRNTR